MSIQIFTSVVNRPDFLEIQKKLFDKFLINDYEFSIVDDSVNEDITFKFKTICDDYNINYYKSPLDLEHGNPSTKVGNVIQWAFDEIIKKKHSSDIVLWVDSDMFLIEEFDIQSYMKDCVISGLPQVRGNIKYMWNGLMFFNMPKIFDIDPNIKFNIDFIDGQPLDTGGETYHYFKKNNIEMKETDTEYPTHFNDIELQNEEVTKGYNFELHLNGKFLHYRAASNWNFSWRSLEDPLEKKTKIFNKIIEELLLE